MTQPALVNRHFPCTPAPVDQLMLARQSDLSQMSEL
jgi:hypothetical protein